MGCKRRRQGIEGYTGTYRNRDDAGAANAREKNFTAAAPPRRRPGALARPASGSPPVAGRATASGYLRWSTRSPRPDDRGAGNPCRAISREARPSRRVPRRQHGRTCCKSLSPGDTRRLPGKALRSEFMPHERLKRGLAWRTPPSIETLLFLITIHNSLCLRRRPRSRSPDPTGTG